MPTLPYARDDSDGESSGDEGYGFIVPPVNMSELGVMPESPSALQEQLSRVAAALGAPPDAGAPRDAPPGRGKAFATAAERERALRPTDWDLAGDLAGDASTPAAYVMDAVVTGAGTAAKTVNGHTRAAPLALGAHAKLVAYRKEGGGPYRCVKVYQKRRMRKMRTGSLSSGESDVQRECLLWSRLPPHPNVVRVFEVVCDPEHPKVYVIMELLPGGDVLCPGPFSAPPPEVGAASGVLGEGFGWLPADVVRRRMLGVLRGIAHLHAHGVVHGDVKPSNLLLAPDGGVKVADLGAAQATSETYGDRLDRSLGTPAFTPPECATPGTFSGFKHDAWCCGVVLHLLLYGRMPVWRAGAAALYEALAATEAVPLGPAADVPGAGDAPAWPGDLESAVEGLLRRDPGERMSVAEAAAVLSGGT